MKDRDIMVGLLLIAVACAGFAASYYFPETAIWSGGADDRPYQATAGTWPRIVCVALFVLSFILIVVKKYFPCLMESDREKEFLEQEKVEPEEKRASTYASRRHALSFMGVFILYLFLIVPLGFPVATLLFGAGCIFTLDMGKMSKKAGLIWSTGVSVIIIVLFCRVLYLPLPRGLGIFRDFTTMIIF